MAGKDNETKLALGTLDANTKTSLAEIENKWRTQIQTSASLANSYQSLTDSITRVMMDPDLDVTGKQTAINNLTKLYDGQMNMQSKLTGLDLGNLLTTGITAPAGGGSTVPNTTDPNSPNYQPPADMPFDGSGA
jgi:hypothetical protein